MNRITLAALAACIACAAHADPVPARMRGTITQVEPARLTLHPMAGPDQTILLAPETRVTLETRGSLADVTPDSYIGVTAKGEGADMTAIGIAIFPPAARGTGEGHRPWDRVPDQTASGNETNSSMTNGTVATTMTNGTVAATGTTLTLTYKGGEQTVTLTPSTPVVIAHPADRAALVVGAHATVFMLDGAPALTARAINVGAPGVIPPM